MVIGMVMLVPVLRVSMGIPVMASVMTKEIGYFALAKILFVGNTLFVKREQEGVPSCHLFIWGKQDPSRLLPVL